MGIAEWRSYLRRRPAIHAVDVAELEDFDPLRPGPDDPPTLERPRILYMGGPIGPVAPVLGPADDLPYVGRNPGAPVGPYADEEAMRWRYTAETLDPQRLGQLKEKLGFGRSGALDAVFGRIDAANLVCIGAGDARFDCRTIRPDLGRSFGVALGDVNQDGYLDAVFARDGQPDRVCLGDGAGSFACSNVSGASQRGRGVAIGDVDADGHLDAVFANYDEPNQVCRGLGGGMFTCSAVNAETRNSTAVALADMDGDGLLDAVFANDGERNEVCYGIGGGALQCYDTSAAVRSSTGVAVGHVNADGRMDADIVDAEGDFGAPELPEVSKTPCPRSSGNPGISPGNEPAAKGAGSFQNAASVSKAASMAVRREVHQSPSPCPPEEVVVVAAGADEMALCNRN